ncbi:MAG: glycine--tRNA ligase [Candidatus Aenigmarchaeota archaeon]|nr:glycine--tRNA ligase [Candidatus Aenigmarchaeota archaeon]
MVSSDQLIEIAKRRGFFWQGSAIYGSLAGFFDYAHLGVFLKRRWETLWRKYFLGLDENYYEIQPSLIMHENVFKASGHLESFADPVAKCGKCGNAERADHILEDVLKENFEGVSVEDLLNLIKKHGIKCGKCKGEITEVRQFNMMFPLKLGVGKQEKTGYLTGETAQGAYVNFKQMFEVCRKKLPLGLAIIGKAFRNEIAPRNALIRMRELTQAELQIFFDPDTIEEHPNFKDVENYKLQLFPFSNRQSNKIEELTCKQAVEKLKLPKFYVYHLAKVQQFYLDVLKLPREKFRFKQLSDEEKAFYNKFHWDMELNLDSLGGWKEIGGVHYRTDHDLKGHQKTSSQSMEISLEGKKVLPHVLELSFGVDRNLYSLLELAYTEEKDRTVLKFPRAVSPFDAGIFPLVNKDGLQEKAKQVQQLLEEHGFVVFYDDGGSIGRRYRRIDEIGVAAGLTIDYDSLKQDDATIRDRDSMKQIRVKIKDLPQILRKFLQGEELEKLKS